MRIYLSQLSEIGVANMRNIWIRKRLLPDAPFGNFGDEYAVKSRRHYYANVTFIDDQIGQIIETLKEKGMYDDAVICFTADHG